MTAKAGAIVTVTTNRQNLSTGTVTITAGASTSVSGEGFTIADGTIAIRQWDGIVPGATMTWEPVQTSRGS